MTAIRINSFSGVAPYISPRYLAESQAQIAKNVAVWVDPLRPIKGSSYLMDFAKSGDIASIYRFGKSLNSQTQYWFHWLENVDVVEGFIHNDTTERTFFTGTGNPMVTDSSLALGGTQEYPTSAYLLGVPAPTTAPACVVTGVPDAGAISEDRVYTFTYVNSWGEESAPYAADPMPAFTQVTVETGQSVEVTTPGAPTGNYNITHKRIYRATNGVYLFVAEVPVADLLFVDSVAADALGEEIPSLLWDAPPAALQGLVGLPNGVLAGFVGNSVYLAEPYRPFAFPLDYMQTVKHKIVALAVIDTTVVVLTTGVPSFIQGSHPDSVVVVDADVSQSCVSKESVVVIDGVVYYASPDGIVALAPSGSSVVTKKTFTKEQWQNYAPETIRAYVHEGRYIGFYDNGTIQAGFIFDPADRIFVDHGVYATGGYNDLQSDTLFLVVDNKLHIWEGGDYLDYVWRSKKFTTPAPIAFSCFRVAAESYPVHANVYADGVLLHTDIVDNDSVCRLPPGRYKTWEIELAGSNEVYEVTLAQTPEECAGG